MIGRAAANNFKKFVLELGGSDPFVVLEDTDLEQAAQIGANARLQNSGQSGICAKRFIVVKPVWKEFNEKLVRKFEEKKVGNPLDRDKYVGPLVNKQAVDTIDSQVKDAISKGAEVEFGGSRRTPGAFYEPTVLDRIKDDMKVMTEEVFGPVAPLYVVENEREALETANETEFGLGASVWTTNLEAAGRAIEEIESGMVFVNQMTKSDPRMPFGGIKRSGIGRELSSFGIREFVKSRSISTKSAIPMSND